MNPGVLSYILITLSSILLWCGWREQTIGSSSIRAAFVFVAAWLIASRLQWTFSGGTLLTPVYVPLLVLAGNLLRGMDNTVERGSAISFSLLLGAVYSFVQLIEAIDPLLIVFHPVTDPLVLTSLLLIVYSRDARIQMLIVTLCTLTNDVYMTLLYREWGALVFGGRHFQDRWWLTTASVRMGSEVVVAACVLIRGVIRIRR